LNVFAAVRTTHCGNAWYDGRKSREICRFLKTVLQTKYSDWLRFVWITVYFFLLSFLVPLYLFVSLLVCLLVLSVCCCSFALFYFVRSFVCLFVSSFSSLSHFLLLLLLLHMSAIVLVQAAEMLLRLLI